MYIYGTGTVFALELLPSFSNMLTDAYVGAYINNQKTIEKIAGTGKLSVAQLDGKTYTLGYTDDEGAATAAAMEALHIIQEEPERLEALWDVTHYALERFREEGFEIGDTESPIIPLYVRDIDKTFIVTKLAFEAGVFINPVIPPACAPQDTLVRFALMANHTKEQVERGVQALKKIFVEQGIIK